MQRERMRDREKRKRKEKTDRMLVWKKRRTLFLLIEKGECFVLFCVGVSFLPLVFDLLMSWVCGGAFVVVGIGSKDWNYY